MIPYTASDESERERSAQSENAAKADDHERERTAAQNIPYHMIHPYDPSAAMHTMGLPFSDPMWFPGIPGMPLYDFTKPLTDMPVSDKTGPDDNSVHQNVNNLLL